MIKSHPLSAPPQNNPLRNGHFHWEEFKRGANGNYFWSQVQADHKYNGTLKQKWENVSSNILRFQDGRIEHLPILKRPIITVFEQNAELFAIDIKGGLHILKGDGWECTSTSNIDLTSLEDPVCIWDEAGQILWGSSSATWNFVNKEWIPYEIKGKHPYLCKEHVEAAYHSTKEYLLVCEQTKPNAVSKIWEINGHSLKAYVETRSIAYGQATLDLMFSKEYDCILSANEAGEVFAYLGKGQWHLVSLPIESPMPYMGTLKMGFLDPVQKKLWCLYQNIKQSQKTTPGQAWELLELDFEFKANWQAEVKELEQVTDKKAAPKKIQAVTAMAFPIKVTNGKISDPSQDVLGGTVEGAPLCKECQNPMTLLCIFKNNPERLPLKHHVAVGVFCCFDENLCKNSGLNDPGNAVVLYKEIPPIHETNKAIKYLRPQKDILSSMEGEKISSDSKVGGFPDWIQGEVKPLCRVCQKPLRFIAQLNEEEEDWNFAMGGCAYIFLCEEEHEGQMCWQAS